MCRSLGIPARYVSGYLFTDRDDTGEVPVGDTVFVQTHAWMEAAVPGWGWLALDPTNGQVVGEHHVKIGHGRSYDDVHPLRGVFLARRRRACTRSWRSGGSTAWTCGAPTSTRSAPSRCRPRCRPRAVARSRRTRRLRSNNSRSNNSNRSNNNQKPEGGGQRHGERHRRQAASQAAPKGPPQAPARPGSPASAPVGLTCCGPAVEAVGPSGSRPGRPVWAAGSSADRHG